MTGHRRIFFEVPYYWTQEQAYAVYELLQDLSACILVGYDQEIIDEHREQYMPPERDESASAPQASDSSALDDDEERSI